ncbi:DUF4926 domain-containing protein [Phormidesmis priestleyi]|uniref:DUF4926 domain-containing protein n=1 Tax=Phormidesmis priestleyi TaxID=268141 RepID=UPI001E659624|nr:DUF4926 domain-containing protein [Phormidesmis priestleyi]
MKFALFSRVALSQDIPKYNLRRGSVGTVVEFYPMPEGQEDGYSLEGLSLKIRSRCRSHKLR